jgi:hypothetical protein
MNFKNKWTNGISIGVGLILFICVVLPFIREQYLSWRLGSVDAVSILIREGDLPSGFTSGTITDVDNYYKPTQAKEQEILAPDGTQVGSVNVFLFASRSDQLNMFDINRQVESQEGIIPYEVSGIGDCEDCIPIFSISGCDIRVVFTRCTAVAIISIYAACNQKEYDFDMLVGHAKRLDESLKSIACY